MSQGLASRNVHVSTVMKQNQYLFNVVHVKHDTNIGSVELLLCISTKSQISIIGHVKLKV